MTKKELSRTDHTYFFAQFLSRDSEKMCLLLLWMPGHIYIQILVSRRPCFDKACPPCPRIPSPHPLKPTYRIHAPDRFLSQGRHLMLRFETLGAATRVFASIAPGRFLNIFCVDDLVKKTSSPATKQNLFNLAGFRWIPPALEVVAMEQPNDRTVSVVHPWKTKNRKRHAN